MTLIVPRRAVTPRAVGRFLPAAAVLLAASCTTPEDRPLVIVDLSPAGGGTVAVNAFTCNRSGCVVEVSPGEATLRAEPEAGYAFDRWSGGCSGTAPSCRINARVAGEYQVTAHFASLVAPAITAQPADVTVAEQGTAQFTVTSTGSAPLAYQWFRSAPGGQTFAPVSGATGPVLTVTNVPVQDDGAVFRATVTNAVGSATSSSARLTVLAGACPTPPLPTLDQSAPPSLTPPAAALGVNAVTDGAFNTAVRVGTLPVGFGYWRFDAAATVPLQQGIQPRSAPTMVQFVGSGNAGVYTGTASETAQLVDVSALSAQIDAEQLTVSASAWFNRVTGCALTDDAFGVQIVAYDGVPATFPARHSAGVDQAAAQGLSRDVAVVTGAWLRHRTGALRHDTPGIWRQAAATMDVPAGTRFLAIVLYATENKSNDPAFPEFHGHYADDAAVVLSLRP